jgi:hypothetical protein
MTLVTNPHRSIQLTDAVHLSAARELKVDVFATVDDKLLKRAARMGEVLGVRVLNPVGLLEELGNVDR